MRNTYLRCEDKIFTLIVMTEVEVDASSGYDPCLRLLFKSFKSN